MTPVSQITFESGSETLHASLGTDGVWICPGWPALAQVMTADTRIYRTQHGAVHEPPGMHATLEWAKRLDGKATFREYPVFPGRIY